MRKFLFPAAIAAVAFVCIFWACSKEENALTPQSITPKSAEVLNIDYYYSLGEGHNEALAKLHSMNIPENASIREMVELLAKEEGSTLPEWYVFDTPLFKSFTDLGVKNGYSQPALEYCNRLDVHYKELEKFIKNGFEGPEPLIQEVYAYTTHFMQMVWNSYQKELISSEEKEDLLSMLGIYGKSSEYWTRYFFKTMSTTYTKQTSPIDELLWMIGYICTVGGADARGYNGCMGEIRDLAEEYHAAYDEYEARKLCFENSGAASRKADRDFLAVFPKPIEGYVIWPYRL